MSPNTAKIARTATKTRACESHDRDLVHELSERFRSMERYDGYIARAEGHPDLQEFWRGLKDQDRKTIIRLKRLIEEEIKNGNF
jgi:hypothetical protein